MSTDDDTTVSTPPLRSLAYEWVRGRHVDRQLAAIPKRAVRRARFDFFVADCGRFVACYLPSALAALAVAAATGWPLTVALVVAAAPAAAGARVVSEKRPYETFKAWREAQTT